MTDTMAIDQYGKTYHALGTHPRKTLIERIGSRHVERMYIDTKEGTRHVGYIIGGLWLTLYRVERIERAA